MRFTSLLLAVVLALALAACGTSTTTNPDATPDPEPDPDSPPTTGTTTFTTLHAGGSHTLALDENGDAWAWGFGGANQLGTGSTDDQSTPARVTMPGGVTFTTVEAGGSHSVALDDSGTAWTWGLAINSQLGQGTPLLDQSTPSQVTMPTGVTFTTIDAGYTHTLAIDQTGNVWAWGDDRKGQLGDDTTLANQATPVQVDLPSGTTITAISAGHNHSLALDDTGAAWAWGSGLFGSLGNSDTSDQPTPVQVTMPDGVTFTSVHAGGWFYGDHSLALDDTGTAWAWGDDRIGQLGTTSNHLSAGSKATTPVQVTMPAGVTFTSLTAGGSHNHALANDGTTWTWGADDSDQLGDGPGTTDQPTPTQLTTPDGVTFATLSAGSEFTLALDTDNTPWAWGNNTFGTLGNGSTGTNEAAPVQVDVP